MKKTFEVRFIIKVSFIAYLAYSSRSVTFTIKKAFTQEMSQIKKYLTKRWLNPKNPKS